MNKLIFDTETISIDKPYCYNIGYVIISPDGEVLTRKEFVIEQIWNNRPLFNSAYYAGKRPLYVSSMRGRKARLVKYGRAQAEMINDIKKYKVDGAYAFNSPFDDRVFEFNSDHYNCRNTLDTIPVFDIRGYAMQFICNREDYQNFCEEHREVKGADGKSLKFFTETGNYKTTAESVYCFLHNTAEFDEAHTALNDSEIETEILLECIKRGAPWNVNLETPKILAPAKPKKMQIKVDGLVIATVEYKSKRNSKGADGLEILNIKSA